eukprot:11697408-Heterocapsa_arctica.AAC.1
MASTSGPATPTLTRTLKRKHCTAAPDAPPPPSARWRTARCVLAALPFAAAAPCRGSGPRHLAPGAR